MALVAYDNSDSSEIEDENENTPEITLYQNCGAPVLAKSLQSPENSPENVEEDKHEQNLFNLLPQPSSKKSAVIEEDDEFLHKKETAPNVVKPKAKIMVPSLSDFKDVEDRPAARPKVTNGKKSGLLSMLPQPRNAATVTTKSLIPHVLTKPSATKKKDLLPSPRKKPKPEKPLITHDSDDSDNGEEVQNDFFSIHKPMELPAEDVPLDIDTVPMKQNQPPDHKQPIKSYFKQDHVELQPDYDEDYSESSVEGAVHEVEQGSSSSGQTDAAADATGDMVLDDEAIMKLCGTRGKRKREDIHIVDVNQDEVLAGAREMLLKGLMDDTSSRVSASKKKGNEPTGQQKRKHQITYLAHQAKANEAELQNQWANSRMSRRQTQSKYGF